MRNCGVVVPSTVTKGHLVEVLKKYDTIKKLIEKLVRNYSLKVAFSPIMIGNGIDTLKRFLLQLFGYLFIFFAFHTTNGSMVLRREKIINLTIHPSFIDHNIYENNILPKY